MLCILALSSNTCVRCDLQVTFLGDAPVSSGDASHLMDWKEASRRVLLQRSGESRSVSHTNSLVLRRALCRADLEYPSSLHVAACTAVPPVAAYICMCSWWCPVLTAVCCCPVLMLL